MNHIEEVEYIKSLKQNNNEEELNKLYKKYMEELEEEASNLEYDSEKLNDKNISSSDRAETYNDIKNSKEKIQKLKEKLTIINNQSVKE